MTDLEYNKEIILKNLTESQQKELISDTESRMKKKMDAMTQIPESIAKQPLDPNADYSQRTELVDQALNLVKKVFRELEIKN